MNGNGSGKLREAIERAMARYPDSRSAILPALRAAEGHYGWCSPQAIEEVAEVMGLTPAWVESVASFYDMFHREQAGAKKILVCTNLSCMMRGSHALVEAFEQATRAPLGGSSEDGRYQLESFECLGGCEMAPMASIDGHYRGPLMPEDAQRAIDDIEAGREPLPEKASVGDYGRKQAIKERSG